MPPKLERAEQLVVARELAFTLVDLDHHGRLVVVGGREDLGGLGRDGRVALDELRHHAALGLDAEAQGGDVDEQHVLALAPDDARLEGGAHGDDLVGVDALVGLLAAGEFRDDVGDGGHAGGAAHHDHVVDVGELDARVLDDLVEGRLGALEQVLGHLLELGPRELDVDVDGAVLADAEVLERDRGLLGGAEFLLGLLGRLAQALDGGLVLGQVDALGVLDLLDEEVDDALVPVVAAEAVVAGGGAHLNGRELVLVLAHLEQRDVERSATEVEDEDELVFLALVEAVRESGRGGLVDDAQHVEARDLAGVLRGLALGVVEVCGDGDDRIGHLLAQVLLGVTLELAEDARGDLLRRVLLVVDLHAPVGAHVALDRRNGAIDVGDGLALGDFADEHLARLRERDHRWGGASALGVCDDGGLSALQDGNHRVGGSQVNAYCTGHGGSFLCGGLPPSSGSLPLRLLDT